MQAWRSSSWRPPRLYVLGSVGTGALAGRLGRRRVLGAAAFLMAAGAGMAAAAPAWWLFMAANGAWALGAGALEVALNGLFLDVFHDDRGRALSRLHLFYSLGALTAPLAVGLLAGAGLPWRVMFLTTSGAVLAIGLCFAAIRAASPTSRRIHPTARGRVWPGSRFRCCSGPRNRPLRRLRAGRLELACPVPRQGTRRLATLTLCSTGPGSRSERLVGSRIGDRATAIAVATVCGIASGAALVCGVLAPWLPLSMAMFAVGGISAGPSTP